MDVTQEMWEDCLSLDEIIQEILEDEGDSWKPVVQGLQNIVQKGEEFAKEITEGRGEAEAWHCLNCGAMTYTALETSNCQICESASNWLSV